MENKVKVDLEFVEYRNIKYCMFYMVGDRSFHVSSTIGNVFDKYDTTRDNNTMGFETPNKAIKAMENYIDDVIDNLQTTTYEELASKIDSLSFIEGEDGYEIDPEMLKLIIENFKLEQ